MNTQKALDICAHALSKDPHRPSISGFGLTRKDGHCYIVGTDTHRLAVCEVDELLLAEDKTVSFGSGRFPDWERVIPTESIGVVDIYAEPLLCALKCLYPIAKHRANKIVLRIKGATMAVLAKSEAVGYASVEVPLVEPYPKSFQIALNVNYVMDVAVIAMNKTWRYAKDSPVIRVDFTVPSRSVVFTVSHIEGYKEIVMPMAITPDDVPMSKRKASK